MNRKQAVNKMRGWVGMVICLMSTMFSFGQKFMVKNGDTLPYQVKMEINNGDTTYLGASITFEKVNGRIINRTDENCVRQGHWKNTDSSGTYWEGDCKDGKAIGLWKQYSKSGKLLKEQETVSVAGDTYTVKEIDYSSGHPVIVVNKPFLAFYLKNLYLIMIVFFVAFFSRVFINSIIYNRENNTNHSPIYFFAPGYVTQNYGHSIICTFTFWFSKYKPENRKLVLISNTLSVIALGIFFGIIIAFTITGEIG
jgi:hypothetical protein